MLQVGTDRVLQGLITQIFQSARDNKLPKYAIHKVLFRLKMELPDENSIKNHLPFYWYNYGPFSDVIESNISGLKSFGILKEYTLSEEKSLLGLEKAINPPETDDFKEANEILSSIAGRVDFYHFSSFVDEIYRKYAPCSFMPLLKLDFLGTMEDYVERVSSGQQTLLTFIDEYPDLDNLEKILYDCEANLPSISFFQSFNNSFSSFITGVGRVFDYIREDGEEATSSGEEVLHTAEVAWFTFAKGIRILDVGHDKYYNNKLGAWRNQYSRSLFSFHNHVDNFNSSVLTEIEPNRLPISAYTEKSKKFLSSVIEGYSK